MGARREQAAGARARRGILVYAEAVGRALACVAGRADWRRPDETTDFALLVVFTELAARTSIHNGGYSPAAAGFVVYAPGGELSCTGSGGRAGASGRYCLHSRIPSQLVLCTTLFLDFPPPSVNLDLPPRQRESPWFTSLQTNLTKRLLHLHRQGLSIPSSLAAE